MVKRTHQLLKERARSRVDDLQAMFSAVQSARRDGRVADMAALEGRLGCLLREWGAELAEDSSASLQLNYEDEEDATSKLAKLPLPIPKVEQTEDFEPKACMNQELPKPDFVGSGSDQYTDAAAMELQHALIRYLEGTAHLEYQQCNQYREWTHGHDVLHGYNTGGQNGGDSLTTHISEIAPSVFPSPPAISRPKCALWDCPRPAQGSGWYQDYCSSFHATLAFNEGSPGATPVLRPGGIDLKDGPLFSALSAKSQGKNVGIPECERAATTKSPWNAPELFDLVVLDGESLREWLFFDKPRRAFDSGNRKQRSLPDYCGRGWHESRKQVMKEYGGLKRSYYMDPQPLSHYEWHLYEYEISNCDACALYRLEFKLVHPKKSSRAAKGPGDSLLDLQQQMKRLNAESLIDNKLLVNKEAGDRYAYSSGVFDRKKDVRNRAFPSFDETAPLNEDVVYGPSLPYCYNVEALADYYQT